MMLTKPWSGPIIPASAMRPKAWIGLAFGVLGVTFAAAASDPDPWARVPALPSGCYQSDGFAGRLATAQEAVKRDLSRQEKINDELTDRLKTIDPMEMASRMQDYIMEHPEEGMALMQHGYDAGTSSAVVDHNEKLEVLFRELDEIDTRYNTALDGRMAPIKKKFEDLDARAQKDLVVSGESRVYAPWAVKEYNTITIEENAAYETLCAEWWSAAGPYRAWLGRYRDHLVRDWIPAEEESGAAAAGYMVILISTPEVSYKPTSTLSAIDGYLDQVSRVFAKRRSGPINPME